MVSKTGSNGDKRERQSEDEVQNLFFDIFVSFGSCLGWFSQYFT
jgi:hypothetical protein